MTLSAIIGWGTDPILDQVKISVKKEKAIGIALITVGTLGLLYAATTIPWKRYGMRVAQATPFFQQELKKFEDELEAQNFKDIDTSTIITSMPAEGKSKEEILACLSTIKGSSGNGKNSGAVYIENSELDALINEVNALAIRTNPLHLSLCPTLRRLETEVIAMTASLFNGDLQVRGNVTTGGTLSILHAVYTARERAKEQLGIASGWQMIVPSTAHPAFDKAATMFCIEIVRIPVHPQGHTDAFKADVDGMLNAITSKTIFMAGSFPSFPHGMIDPIDELSNRLESVDPDKKIGLHIDACLGGFCLPWITHSQTLQKLDAPLGFDNPRVTSISADTHKYGYDKKGSSVVLYRNEEWYSSQIFTTTEWSGGIYTSPTFEGSRAGSNIATAWAVMNYFGKEKYVEATEKILGTAQGIVEKCRDHPDIEILGNPRGMVVAFASKNPELNIYDMLEEMKAKGWYLSPLQNPPAFHLCVTAVHGYNTNFVENFMEELNASIEAVKAYPLERRGKKGEAHVYGTNAKLGLSRFVKPIAHRYWVVNARPIPSK